MLALALVLLGAAGAGADGVAGAGVGDTGDMCQELERIVGFTSLGSQSKNFHSFMVPIGERNNHQAAGRAMQSIRKARKGKGGSEAAAFPIKHTKKAG